VAAIHRRGDRRHPDRHHAHGDPLTARGMAELSRTPSPTARCWCRAIRACATMGAIPTPDTTARPYPFLYRGPMPDGVSPLVLCRRRARWRPSRSPSPWTGCGATARSSSKTVPDRPGSRVSARHLTTARSPRARDRQHHGYPERRLPCPRVDIRLRGRRVPARNRHSRLTGQAPDQRDFIPMSWCIGRRHDPPLCHPDELILALRRSCYRPSALSARAQEG
jgi:hypothetical protein